MSPFHSPNSTHSFRGKHVKDILPQHVHGLNIEIEAPMKSIIEILKSPNAVLGVLALALLAQMPHAADVFRLTVKGA